ncbi:MAG: sulfite exporter TauE/SafE family protein [Deltaproteobacteria bacterium]|nr:sulfite exporter TauE/SafE family protein [Deltaproteobacteria bacterium]
MPFEVLILVPFFFLAAFLYSSVGHGGASAYLAILVLAGFPREGIAPTVLVLNILVTLLGTISYYRAGHFDARLLLPFILTSVPAAYLGGSLRLSEQTFSTILGLTLLVAGLRLLVFTKAVTARPPVALRLLLGMGLPVGFALGFLAGLIGIGGGIFLSPLLLLMGWADAKKTAAVSAGFILLNSLSGLTAHIIKGAADWPLLGGLAITVLIGGGIGSYIGAFRLLPITLQRILGAVLLLAAFKLFI